MRRIALFLLLLVINISAMAQYPSVAAYINSGSGPTPWSAASGSGGIATPPPAAYLYCLQSAGPPQVWAPCNPGSGSGTVTSVTFTGDGIIDSATPSAAVTTSGTVAATPLTQTANCVFAGPVSGSAARPTCRSLVTADVPTLNQNTTGNAATATALAATPTLCPTGQAPTGIVASGNATGCAAVGVGTVTSVTGTANQIDVATGTTTPVISLDTAIILPGSLTGKVINGVSYSCLYPGATLDARVNACLADALTSTTTKTNGNTTGICDSRCEGNQQSIVSQITVGDGTHPILWRVPSNCYWQSWNI